MIRRADDPPPHVGGSPNDSGRHPDAPVLDARMRRSIVAVSITGGVLSLAALLFFGLTTALSVGMGAALAAVNLWVLARIVAALLPAGRAGARAQSKAAWGLLAMIKLFGLIAVVWLLMRHGIVSPIPMVFGFGALPIGIAIGSLLSDRDASSDDES
jgi:hypothetical protein